MKYILSFYLSLLMISICSAEPFYGEMMQDSDLKAVKNNENIANSMAFLPACQPPKDSRLLTLSISFEQLKFIGVIKQAERFKALFIDETNKIYDFMTNDYLVDSNIKIERINLKSVEYVDFMDCDNPILKTKHL